MQSSETLLRESKGEFNSVHSLTFYFSACRGTLKIISVDLLIQLVTLETVPIMQSENQGLK